MSPLQNDMAYFRRNIFTSRESWWPGILSSLHIKFARMVAQLLCCKIYLFILLLYVVFSMQSREMDPQLLVGPDQPSYAGYESLPFMDSRGLLDLKWTVMQGYPLSGYDYFTIHHCVLEIIFQGENMSYFKGKDTLVTEFQSRFCKHLKDDISVGQEDVTGESPISTLLHDMNAKDGDVYLRHKLLSFFDR